MARARVLFVIESLDTGGAQKQLHLLLTRLDRAAFAPIVLCLNGRGVWSPPIRAQAVPLLELPRAWPAARRLAAVVAVMRRLRPDLVQTFLLYDNLYGTLAARLAGVPRLIASRRYDPDGRQRGLAHRLNRVAWRFADAIVCNTARAARSAPLGLRARHVVIPNGAAPAATLGRRAARERLGLETDALVVGTVGRVAATKNPALFAAVAATVGRRRPEARWLWIGGGPLEDALRARAATLGLSGRLAVTGDRSDAPALLEALDVFLLTSDREGMSNGLMEAMAAGVPCVVTDAGGNAELVADMVTGFVRPTGDAAGLAERVERLLDDPALRARLGGAGAGRIAGQFTAELMSSSTERLYRRLLFTTPSVEPARPPAWPVAS